MLDSLAVMGIDRRRAITFRPVALNDARETAAEAEPQRCRIQMATVYFKGKVNTLYFLADVRSLSNDVATYCPWLLANSQRAHTCLQLLQVFCSNEGCN